MPDRAFQDLGDKLTKALISGDFPAYESVMALPLTITPRQGAPYVLDSRADLRADFELYHSIIRLHGVTDIYRQVITVDQPSAFRAVVHCVTHILVRANRLADPFETHMHLAMGPGGWRISGIESSEGHINWTLGRAIVDGGQFAPPPAPTDSKDPTGPKGGAE